MRKMGLACSGVAVLMMVPFFLAAQTDTVVLTLRELFERVAAGHPVARQADLVLEKGEARLLAAKGGFDPRLFARIDQKEFEDKRYFRHLDGGVLWPSWWGIEVQSGLEQNRGVFLNPEQTTPPGGLWYAGLSLSLGRGLGMDARRAALFKARIFKDAAVVERRQILNDLFVEVAMHYWDWVQAWYQQQIIGRALALSRERFDLVKEGFFLGARAAMDTLESYTQVQTLEQDSLRAAIQFQTARLALSAFLWSEDREPLLLGEQVMPPNDVLQEAGVDWPSGGLDAWMTRVNQSHPEIQGYDYQISALQVDRRLMAEQFKPRIDLRYNLVAEALSDETVGQISTRNYKWGLDVGFPLFLRRERGDYQLARIRLEELTLERESKLPEWRNRVRAHAAERELLQEQIGVLQSAVENYRRLLDAERTRFASGESSQFLLNTRQANLLQAEMKLLESRIRLQRTAIALRWAMGMAGPQEVNRQED